MKRLTDSPPLFCRYVTMIGDAELQQFRSSSFKLATTNTGGTGIMWRMKWLSLMAAVIFCLVAGCQTSHPQARFIKNGGTTLAHVGGGSC
ncbi:MAG: hypothetical protein KatS3mg105_3033 [Gemmatales bacterium]|nr:MAG: hypothetical protein KatS3mg105_3033 [Gemmatales bacterium]